MQELQEIPETATLYSRLSQCFMRWCDGELQVYCQYSRRWKKSAIKDFTKAQVVKV